MYLSDLKAAGLQRVIESWSEVHSAVSTWEQPQWQILHYQRELPQKLIDEIKSRTYGETLPTAKQFSAAYPPPDVVDAMQTQLLGPPPKKKKHTHTDTHTHTHIHTHSLFPYFSLSLSTPESHWAANYFADNDEQSLQGYTAGDPPPEGQDEKQHTVDAGDDEEMLEIGLDDNLDDGSAAGIGIASG